MGLLFFEQVTQQFVVLLLRHHVNASRYGYNGLILLVTAMSAGVQNLHLAKCLLPY